MGDLDQPYELTARGRELRARSAQLRGAAEQVMADSRWALAAAAEALEAVRYGRGGRSATRQWPRPCGPPGAPGGFRAVGPDPADSSLAGRLQASQRESRALRQMSQEARARARTVRDRARQGRLRRGTPAAETLTWLLAEPGTTPVIEQAKGIIMAQQRCGPEEASDLLYRASQRSSVKVHVFASRIVNLAASSGNGSR